MGLAIVDVGGEALNAFKLSWTTSICCAFSWRESSEKTRLARKLLDMSCTHRTTTALKRRRRRVLVFFGYLHSCPLVVVHTLLVCENTTRFTPPIRQGLVIQRVSTGMMMVQFTFISHPRTRTHVGYSSCCGFRSFTWCVRGSRDRTSMMST